MKIFNDERASSVMFATLMLILIVITVGSAFAFTLSLNQKQYMERQSALTAQQNENLKIISIKPYPNEVNKSYWAGFDFTIFNGDINDADIKAISVNDKFMIDRFVYNGTGWELHNGSELINVPAGQAVKVHVGAIKLNDNIDQNGTETDSSNFGYFETDNGQWINLTYLNMTGGGWYNVYDSGGLDITALNNSTFYLNNDNIHSFVTPLNINSTSINYPLNVQYTLFPNDELYPFDSPNQIFFKKAPIKVELLTERINLFSKVFSPPNPIANVYQTTGSNPSLILDASGSTAPNGFITDYEWDINSNSTPLGWSNSTPLGWNLHGVKQQCPYNSADSYDIGLIVTDNYGMSSALSERAGNITIG